MYIMLIHLLNPKLPQILPPILPPIRKMYIGVSKHFRNHMEIGIG